MPLRALVDGHGVVAPLVPAADWRVLAADLRAGRRLAVLPCCGGLAFGRVSAQGLAHFVHQRRGECAGARESLAHLALKTAVARACTAAGWGVEPEAEGPDWRADVLATPHLPTILEDLLGGDRYRPPWRVAFEIQLSRIDGATLLERQARYGRDRVRGCWLLHPSAVGRQRAAGSVAMAGSWGEAMVAARLGLAPEVPAFALAGGDEPAVLCAGRRLPLAAFVTALLGRRVRFRQEMTPAALPLQVLVYEVWCPACRASGHAHLVAGRFLARCGAQGRVERAAGALWENRPPEFDDAIVAGVRSAASTPAGRGLRLCPVRPAGAAGRPAFHCPRCHRPLPAGHLEHAAWPVRLGEVAPAATLALPAGTGLRCRTDVPHWCYAAAEAACGQEGGGTPGRPLQAASGR